MRQMFELVTTVGEQVAKTLTQQIENGGENSFEFREFARKFSVDVIATCALGISVNSFENPKNEIHGFAVKMVNQFSTFVSALKMVGYFLVPKLMLSLKISLLSKETTKFFEDVITETMKVREQQGIVRPDLINLLMQAKKGKLSYEIEKENEKVVEGFATVEESQVGKRTVMTKWEDEDLTSQCFIFFFAGLQVKFSLEN